MEIYIDGNKYVLKEGTDVNRRLRPEWAESVRITGQRTRSDLQDIDTWLIDDASAGYGIEHMDVTNKRDIASFWDSEINTLFPRQKTLPMLRQQASFNTPTMSGDIYYFGHQRSTPLKFLWHHQNKLCGIGCCTAVQTGGQMGYRAFPFVFSNGVWTGGIPNTVGTALWIGNSFKAGILAESNFGSDHVLLGMQEVASIYHNTVFLNHSAVAAEYTINSIVAYGSVAACGSLPEAEAAMTEHSDGFLWAAVYFPATQTVDVRKFSSSYGVTTIASRKGYKVTGMASFYDTDDVSTMFIAFEDGLFMINETNGTFRSVIDLSYDTSLLNGRNMRQHQGKLIIPTRYGMIAYSRDGSYEIIGLDTDSGLPLVKRGEHQALHSNYEFLLQSIQAEDSCAYALHEGGWHFITKGAVASQVLAPIFISSQPDNIQRLHFMSGTLPYFVEHPLENPLQIPTCVFATEGKYVPPKHDAGLPEYQGGYFGMFIEGKVTEYERIQALYGFNGAAPTAELGIATAGNRDMLFSSGQGTQAYYIQPQFNLIRGTLSGTTPVLGSGVVKFLKKPDPREIFDVTIDTELTAQARQNQSRESLWSEIGSLTSRRTQSTLKYGMIATRLVLVQEAPADDWVERRPATEREQERTGEITLRLIEMLPH